MRRLQFRGLFVAFFLCATAFAVGSAPEVSRLARTSESELNSSSKLISDLKPGKRITFKEGTAITSTPSKVVGTGCLVHLESKSETKKVMIYKILQWEVRSVNKIEGGKTELRLVSDTRVFIHNIVVVCPADEKLGQLETLFRVNDSKVADADELNLNEGGPEVDRAAKGRGPRDWDKPRPGSTKGGSR